MGVAEGFPWDYLGEDAVRRYHKGEISLKDSQKTPFSQKNRSLYVILGMLKYRWEIKKIIFLKYFTEQAK